jgi:predicted extracellular nuclease
MSRNSNTNRFVEKGNSSILRSISSFLVLTILILQNILVLAPVAAKAAVPGNDSTIFINEFHYDNASTDVNEFIEIAGPAGTDLTGYSIVLYNGSGGAVYDTDAFSGTIPNQQNGYGTAVISYPSNGIQNGSPDGIALVGPSGLIQFLCYEGTFAAVGGAADGQTCTDIGVNEGGADPVGNSLQLSGTGTTYGNFTWTAPSPNTSGQPNTGQTFGGTDGTPTPSPTATPIPSPSPTPSPTPPINSNIIINELDADTPGSDIAEFIELFDGGTGNTALDGLVLVFYNGGDDKSYRSIDLDGYTTDSNGYFTVGNAAVSGVNLVIPNGAIQNGEDAVALYQANGTDFPNGSAVTTANLIDALVYDTSDPDDPGLLVLLNPNEPQVDENSSGQAATLSNQRCPNGGGGARNTSSYLQRTPTPGVENSCPAPAVAAAIHEIQGNSLVSPYNGQGVITNGIVTALKNNGFFLQEPDATVDADSQTSEGIFVFTSAAPTVTVGDFVMVTGTAVEFNNFTEINASNSDVVVNGSNNPLPTPIVLTQTILDPNGSIYQLERLEGMRVAADSLHSVAPTNNFGETYTVLSGLARPFREPGIEISLPVPPDPTSGVVDCCIPRWDQNPERILIDSDGLVGSTRISVTSNVTFTNVIGPLDYNFGDYKIVPEITPSTTANMSAIPVPMPEAGEFTVAGYNIENFKNSDNQRIKAALAIRTLMRLPDIIGVIEILDLASLEALANQVNSDTFIATGSNPMYEARLIQAPLGGMQNVGFLVKTSTIRIDSISQEAGTETFINPNTGLPETLHDRPPLVLNATVGADGGNPQSVIVVVNHLRSFINIETDARVRAKRTAQAESTARLLQDLQTSNPTTPVISVGDYNAYQFNDGYTDPISVIKGMPTSDDEVVVDQSPDFVDPDFINLTDQLSADQRYTFIFEGTPQALDHVIVNSAAYSILQRYAIARSNADFPEIPEFQVPTRPEVNSDHDMPVAYFKFPKRATTLSVSDVSVIYNLDGQNITLTANVATDVNSVDEGTVTFTITTLDGSTTIGTISAAVINGTATADFFLPGNILPQALKINASYSGGDTTLPSVGTGTLIVRYAVCLLYDPSKAVKSGGTYPIKLQLCDAEGRNVSSPDVIIKVIGITLVSAPDTQVEIETPGNSNPDNNFRYEDGRYAFNLKTTGLSQGVYNLSFTAGNDPTIHTIEFRIK